MKLFNYIIIYLGLAMIFELAGISIAKTLLDYVGINFSGVGSVDFEAAKYYKIVIYVLGLAVVGGIIIGLFSRANPENYILVGLINGANGIVGITLFLTVTTGIIAKSLALFPLASDWAFISYITIFIMGLLGAGFIWTLTEWFRGTD